MKTQFILATLLTAFLACGCGKQEAPSTAATTAAPTAAAAGPRSYELTAGDTMRFNLTSLDAKPGEEIKITLTNIGTQPKEVMGHNFVLLKKDVDVSAFAMASMMAKDTDYIPAAKKDEIIVHTEILAPRKSAEVTFKAPAEPGEYPFLCSFAGHYAAGMKGVLVVK